MSRHSLCILRKLAASSGERRLVCAVFLDVPDEKETFLRRFDTLPLSLWLLWFFLSFKVKSATTTLLVLFVAAAAEVDDGVLLGHVTTRLFASLA